MTKNTNYIIRNISILGEPPVNIYIKDGLIDRIFSGEISPKLSDSAHTVNGSGLIALPGLVDLHTHIRDPDSSHSETVISASKAAASGGYTAIHAMPNTSPVADNVSIVEYVDYLGKEAGWVDVRPIGSVTVGLAGNKLAEIGSMAKSRAEVKIFSDDGKCVSNPEMMRRALEYAKTFNVTIAQHAQDPDLTRDAQIHEGAISSLLGMRGWPSIAEETIIARDILLAEYVKAKLHICHVSTAGSVDIIRAAKKRNIQVTAEVTPHHLMFTDYNASSLDPVYKVNPPLRSEKDVLALREGIADGTIDIVATDHAPHPKISKETVWNEASMGMVGLETALSVIHHCLVDTKIIGWREVANIMSYRPAEIAQLSSSQGQPIEVGSIANIVLYDPNKSWIVNVDNFNTAGRNSPFSGMRLPGRVIATFYGGHPTVLAEKLNIPKMI